MNPSAHLSWEDVLRLLDDRAEAPRDRREHADECAACRELVDDARKSLDALPDALAPGAPDTWRARAEKRAVPRSFLAPLQGSIEARVVFDSAHERRAGVRSEAGGDRQWLVAGNRIEIEILLSDPLEQAPYQLSGQLMAVEGVAPDLGNCAVRLEVGDRSIAETRTEPSGEFLLRERPDAPFRLVVEGEGWRIESPWLQP